MKSTERPEIIKREMEAAATLDVPVIVEVGCRG
jgi:DNA polymerase I-like protein with 3'-5' exonuclease and polymerase domains